jgi:hypothetical protein
MRAAARCGDVKALLGFSTVPRSASSAASPLNTVKALLLSAFSSAMLTERANKIWAVGKK